VRAGGLLRRQWRRVQEARDRLVFQLVTALMQVIEREDGLDTPATRGLPVTSFEPRSDRGTDRIRSPRKPPD
jgi:hypothetical protein